MNITTQAHQQPIWPLLLMLVGLALATWMMLRQYANSLEDEKEEP